MDPGHNCTNYAAYRLIHNGIDASYLTGQGNAYQWGPVARAHGVVVDGSYAPGDIAWWDANAGLGSSGHVGYVEQVVTGGFLMSDDNYGGDFHWTKVTGGTGWPTGFIHFQPAVLDDVAYIKTRNTGSGKIEAFTVTKGSNYQSGVAAATRFIPGDASNGWFGMLPNGDVYFIKTRNTGSGKIEAFTVTQASGYQSGVAAATRFTPADAGNGWFGMLPNGDVYFIKTRNTGTGKIEAFTVTQASGYQSGVAAATRFSPGDASNGWFGMLPSGDVYFIKTRNTGSGKIEAFTVTQASGYQSGVAAATRFSPGDASNGWFGMLPNLSVFFVKTKNTGTGKVEAFTVTQGSGYQSGVAAATRFTTGEQNNGWFRLLG